MRVQERLLFSVPTRIQGHSRELGERQNSGRLHHYNWYVHPAPAYPVLCLNREYTLISRFSRGLVILWNCHFINASLLNRSFEALELLVACTAAYAVARY